MQALWQDLRYGARMLLKKPGFTLIAVLTLALGIGAATAIFSVVNGVLLRPLAYREPQQVVRLFEKVDRTTMASDRAEVAPANFLDWRAQSNSFSGLAAYGFGNLPLSGDAEAEVVASAYVSQNLFSVLGVKPLAGRTFTAEEDNPQNEFVAVLSYGLWQRRFGGERGVIGRTINLDGRSYVIIGVMPQGFQFPNQTELWTPLALNDNQVKMREARFLKVVARLKPDVSIAQASEEMKTIASGLSQTYPQTNQNWSVNVVSLLDEEVGKVRPALLVLMGVVALVLLMACANVANLLLARAAGRQGEMAIRLAVGATRARIVRQLLSESLLLALMGGAGGALVAWWGMDALLKLAPNSLPRAGEVRLDGRVLGFALLASLLTGILFGLIPALQTSKPDLNKSLKEGGGKTAGGSRNRALNALVVVEIALAIVVLAGAGLLINSFLRLRQVDSGLNAENVLTVKFTPPSAHYNDRERWRENRLVFFGQLLPRIQSLPGVEAVGAIDSLPLSGGGRVYRFRKDGDDADLSAGPAATFQVAMPDYFRAMGIPLRRGRLFGEADGENAPPVVVINQTMARRFWPNEDALGKRIIIRNQTAPREIIGVIADIKHFGLDRAPEPEMYVPFNQLVIDLIPLVIRTSGNPAQIIAAVRREVQAVDPAVAIAKIQTMPQIAAASLAARRFTVLLLGVFAAVALALAVVGIYGVMSYSVAQRTREIGIRVALGAQGSDVLRLIVTRGMKLTLLGAGAGLLLALALGRWLASSLSGLLFGVTANDPLTLVMIALLLAGASLLACWIPARRATRVDPMIALRCE